MRARPTRAALAAVAAIALLGAAPALAAPRRADAALMPRDAAPAPIGGPQLAGGLAVNLAPGTKALPTSTMAKSWIVADLDTGNVLAAYNPHEAHAPASTLKTLAALALIPRVGPAVQVPFTAAELALTSQKDGVSTRVGLQIGKSYPAKRLFEALLALSANDAAEALSAAAPGGRAAVLDAMNGIAASLQARETHAGTPDGLPAPGQTESAYDEALIVRAALQLPNFSAYDTTPKVTLPGRPPFGGSNHDRLQNSYPGVIGGKDGYTVASGQVWWGAAARYGHRLVVVVMDAGYAPVTQEIDLLNWGFSVDGKIAPVGTLVGPVTAAGQATTVGAVAEGLTPGSTAPPKAIVKAAPRGDSGPWRWVLGGLIALAAVLLGRRHLRAAGPAGRLPGSTLPRHASSTGGEAGDISPGPVLQPAVLRSSVVADYAAPAPVPGPAPMPVPSQRDVLPLWAGTAQPAGHVVTRRLGSPAAVEHSVAAAPAVAAYSAIAALLQPEPAVHPEPEPAARPGPEPAGQPVGDGSAAPSASDVGPNVGPDDVAGDAPAGGAPEATKPAPPAMASAPPAMASAAPAMASAAPAEPPLPETGPVQLLLAEPAAPRAVSPPPPRRLTPSDLRPGDVSSLGIDEPPTTGPAAAPAALEAQHDRLHTGAVKVVPAPNHPAGQRG